MSGNLKLLLLAVAGGILIYLGVEGAREKAPAKAAHGERAPNPSTTTASRASTRDTLRTWGNPASLADHFARHGGDFGARNAQEYATMAAHFLQQAKTHGLPAKIDDHGDPRVFDPRSGAFGAYNPDGTTKTFFKPQSRGYFERQPGRKIDLRTWRG